MRRSTIAALLICTVSGVAGQDSASDVSEDPFSKLHREILEVLRAEFPEAQLKKDRPGRYVFGANLREFVTYRPNKVGEWQKPKTVNAPDRGGISLEFYVENRRWEGALLIPHYGKTDHYLFSETLVVRESTDGQWHVWARILTPRFEPPSRTEERLVQLLVGFEDHRSSM